MVFIYNSVSLGHMICGFLWINSDENSHAPQTGKRLGDATNYPVNMSEKGKPPGA